MNTSGQCIRYMGISIRRFWQRLHSSNWFQHTRQVLKLNNDDGVLELDVCLFYSMRLLFGGTAMACKCHTFFDVNETGMNLEDPRDSGYTMTAMSDNVTVIIRWLSATESGITTRCQLDMANHPDHQQCSPFISMFPQTGDRLQHALVLPMTRNLGFAAGVGENSHVLSP